MIELVRAGFGLPLQSTIGTLPDRSKTTPFGAEVWRKNRCSRRVRRPGTP